MPRLVGKQGAVYLGAHRIADIFDFVLEINQELIDATVKFEVHDVMAAGGVNSRLTASRYITDTTTDITANPEVGGSVAGKHIIANIPAAGNTFEGATVTWTVYTIDAQSKGFRLNGEGFVERVTMNNPRGMATEVWEIRNTVLPTITS